MSDTPRRENVEVLPFTDATAPPTIARVVIWTAMSLVVGALAFIFLARTDVVITGQATVVPSTEAARVQASLGGIVKAIAAHDGDRVQEGDVVLELDATEQETRLELLLIQQEAAEGRIADLEKLVESRSTLLNSEGDLKDVERRVAAAQLVAAQQQANAAKLEQELKAMGQSRTQDLAERGVLSTTDMQQATVAAHGAEADAARARASVQTLRAELSRLSIEKERAGQGAVVAALQDQITLAEARERHATLRGLIAETSLQVERSKIRAPHAGIVQGLAVSSQGEVVSPGQVLAWIIPTEGGLVATVRVPSTGIGFLREGRTARVKLDAYPFQEFGAAEGAVVWISPDALREAGTDSRSLYYDARLTFSRLPLGRDGNPLPLRAGMTGTGELVIRRDRVVFALLEPPRSE
jgi:HlyD family type I secretion membrane fusion protein